MPEVLLDFLFPAATSLGVAPPSPPATVVIDVESVASEMSSKDVMAAKELPASSHVPYMTVAVPVCKRRNSTTIARSPKKRCQNSATAPATAVVKEVDVLDLRKDAESSHLSSKAVDAQEALLRAMRKVSCIYTGDSRNLFETLKLQGGEDLCERADLLLCDPPYNVRHQQDLQNSDHDVFNAKDMKALCNFVEHFLKRKGHGHIFCSARLFAFY